MPRHLASPSLLVLLLGLALPAQASDPPCPCATVIFVADGAGNYQLCSKMLRTAIEETDAPITVNTFVWSHGYKKCLSDQMDIGHARQQGQCLAEAVVALHQEHPEIHINLAGHSAGSMVILFATEYLPPGIVDHVVLLAPSVSCEYDIRPALRCVRRSVEVHYSAHDWLYLGMVTNLVGCADRLWRGASGRKGFSLLVECPEDGALLERLQQHPWQPCDRQLGNNGGHYGAYQPPFLKERVLPVLLEP